jgi:hypothetical protein
MSDELVDDDTLDAIPDGDPGLAFVYFERACRKSLTEALSQEDNSSIITGLQLDYMHEIIAAAQHFNIPELKDYTLPETSDFSWRRYEDFTRRVRFFTTHFRLNAKAQRNTYSVELQGSHKDRIITLIAHLKMAIEKSDMPDWRKSRLHARIIDFEKALNEKRLNFAQAMVFVGLLGAGIHGVGEGAEGLSKLVHEITVVIGQSKEIEDDRMPLLPKPQAPVYLVEDKGVKRADRAEKQGMDDEIPF